MSNYSFYKNHFIIHFRQKNNKLFIRLSRGPLQEILYLCCFLTEQAMSNFELSDQLRKSAWEKDTSDTLPPHSTALITKQTTASLSSAAVQRPQVADSTTDGNL